MIERLTKLLQRSDLVVSKITVRNVINAMLWLAAIVALPCFAFATFGSPSLRLFFA